MQKNKKRNFYVILGFVLIVIVFSSFFGDWGLKILAHYYEKRVVEEGGNHLENYALTSQENKAENEDTLEENKKEAFNENLVLEKIAEEINKNEKLKAKMKELEEKQKVISSGEKELESGNLSENQGDNQENNSEDQDLLGDQNLISCNTVDLNHCDDNQIICAKVRLTVQGQSSEKFLAFKNSCIACQNQIQTVGGNTLEILGFQEGECK